MRKKLTHEPRKISFAQGARLTKAFYMNIDTLITYFHCPAKSHFKLDISREFHPEVLSEAWVHFIQENIDKLLQLSEKGSVAQNKENISLEKLINTFELQEAQFQTTPSIILPSSKHQATLKSNSLRMIENFYHMIYERKVKLITPSQKFAITLPSGGTIELTIDFIAKAKTGDVTICIIDYSTQKSEEFNIVNRTLVYKVALLNYMVKKIKDEIKQQIRQKMPEMIDFDVLPIIYRVYTNEFILTSSEDYAPILAQIDNGIKTYFNQGKISLGEFNELPSYYNIGFWCSGTCAYYQDCISSRYG